MFIRNAFKPGDCIVPIPIGIQIQLRYNDNGILEKVYIGFDTYIEADSSVLETIKFYHSVPFSISAKGGTTWVKGVLYTDKLFNNIGGLPEANYDKLIEYYTTNPHRFNFFACHVSSTAYNFRSYISMQQWLGLSEFKTLPSFIVPAVINKSSISNLISKNYNFKWPLICKYFIYSTDTCEVDTKLYQYRVNNMKMYYDEYGVVKYKLELESVAPKYTTHIIDIGEAVTFNIHVGSYIICDAYNYIIYSYDTDGTHQDNFDTTYICPICGAITEISKSLSTKCSNIHCITSQYTTFSHFIDRMRLKHLNFPSYVKFVDSGKLTELCDIFKLKQYEDIEFSITLDEFLDAVIPVLEVPNRSSISWFVYKCHSNLETYRFYSMHIDRLESMLEDYELQEHSKLLNWYHDAYNCDMVLHLLDSKNIHIVDKNINFNGEPMFFGKKFMLNGEFNHGTHKEIEFIIQSYSGSVVNDISTANIMLIGGRNENINSVLVRKANELNIPVYAEDKFFMQYQIDDDLNQYKFR